MSVDPVEVTVEQIARRVQDLGATVGAVESLTSGAVASALGRGSDAAGWFRGAVVAYQMSTKEAVLGVAPGTDPATPDCAAQLATGGRTLLGVDVCVSVTGVGGPDPEGSHPAGEVHLGIATAAGVETASHRFDGDPADVVEQSVRAAVEAIRSALDGSATGATERPADGIRIEPMRVADAGEVLTVQRAAFVSEAQIYGAADTAPLTQTLEQLEADISGGQGWVARRHGRLVGALSCREADDVLLIGRIAIAPDMQGEGIGRRLLARAEAASTAAEAELFTGSLSEANLRLYRSCGYVETERIDQGDGTAQVFLRKQLR
ncbi:nicotinamide-nucleotide amidohydrolase family protein [Microbacterium sp. T2.11-28]|uniref:nicotinamide-nucleotide amidohydrolase family protein n=1 Tax=Microbacterium sp. T2.11-28 TaxID=3041169 RepID=UPI00247764A7|nr:Putative competence-damage inducible protein [Microbacterium sp. T2.11-28]